MEGLESLSLNEKKKQKQEKTVSSTSKAERCRRKSRSSRRSPRRVLNNDLSTDRRARLKAAPRSIVLVGLPGSGKSFFSRAMESLATLKGCGPLAKWHRVCQDDEGSR